MFENKSDFEKMLEATNSARNEKIDLHEYVESVSEMINVSIRSIIERHQRNIMLVDEGLRSQIKENVKKALDEALDKVEDYPKGIDL